MAVWFIFDWSTLLVCLIVAYGLILTRVKHRLTPVSLQVSVWIGLALFAALILLMIG